MINVSNAFRKELYTGNRNWLEYIDVTLKSGTTLHLTNENIWSGGLTIEDAVSSDNSFDIGGTVVNQCTVVINNIYDEFSDYDFSDAKVIVYVGLNLPNGTTERIRKGTYTVNEPKYNGSLIILTCYDNMSKFDRPYSESTLSYPATLNQIVRDACSKCDVTLQTYDFPHDDFVVTEKPSGESTTFREVIGWAAQIACCFCRCDTLGRLEIKWYNVEAMEADPSLDGGYFDTDNPYSSGADADGGNFNPWNAGYEFDSGDFEKLEHFHHIYSTYSMNVSTDDVVITGVKILEKAPDTESGTEIVTYMTGQEGYVITIEGNELIRNGSGASIVGWIGEKIIGMRFRKADFTHESDPTIEAGDVGFLTDWKQRSYDIIISSTKFTTGGSQSTKSSAEDPLKNSATRFSNATKNYVEYRKEIQKEKTDREQAVEELSNRLNNSSGTFTTVQKQSDGSNIYYLHNKPTLDESDIIWKMTAEAWGVSTDGGKTYNAGMTVDGDTITRILTATGINADWINTGDLSASRIKGGTLTLGGNGNTNGRLRILDASGTQIGQWTNSGIIINKGSFYCKTATTGSSIYGGRMHLTYGDDDIGYIGTNYFEDYSDIRGIVFDLEYPDGDYMAWAAQESSSSSFMVKWLYTKSAFGKYSADELNAGCDIDMHNYQIKNVSWPSGGITQTINYVQVLSVNSDGTVARWGSNGMMRFENGILVDLNYYT